MKPENEEKLNKYVGRLIERNLREEEAEPEEDTAESYFEKFENFIDKSNLHKYVKFKSKEDKLKAIIKFASILGISKKQLSHLFRSANKVEK